MAKLSSIHCSSCGRETDSGARFCPACGSSLHSPDVTATSTPAARTPAPPRTPSPASRSVSKTPISSATMQGRFLPGTLLAERYRLVALLGRGGMGEVYRADDLTLGQAVALKFLPESTANDPAALERFRNEVRIARRISHPNVCRIYDIGESEGLVFLSMEYVDGEDLGSLLRRIGRLPQDKALEIARKLCAGVAAAHDKGVLHRDLKPANIMLNGEGEVVIMDFGLAEVAELIPQDQVRFGTPAYMAPEQLSGKEVTARSDIYSLGLVLYEVFTGKRPFKAETLGEIVRLRSEAPMPAAPSTVVRELDPAVERVILRCLEPEPAARPASALGVAAALPGGDPLAAALAAGETPSPQMVAAAGEVEGLSPKIAVPCLAVIVLGLIACFLIGVHISAFPKMNLADSPDVLRHRAQEIVSELGYTERPADSAWGFDEDATFLDYEKRRQQHPDWSTILAHSPPALRYWYRSSPDDLLVTEFRDASTLTPGRVSPSEPPNTIPGMIGLQLDPQGKLLDFVAIPSQVQNAPLPPKPVDWKTLFSAAGLDLAQFHATDPLWNSLASSDTRAAWTGSWPGGNIPLRVEAAALGGRPVFFSLIGPWSQPDRQVQPQKTSQRISGLFVAILGGVVFCSAALLAYRNTRKKRSDVRAAVRLGLAYFAIDMLVWLLRCHFVAGVGSYGLFLLALCGASYLSAIVAIIYLGLEPYVRRHWPQTIISWSRLSLGRWRDPLVGKDVLFGVTYGAFLSVLFYLYGVVQVHLGDSLAMGDSDFLLDARRVVGAWLLRAPWEVQGTLIFFFLLFLLRVLLRNKWLAATVFVAIWVTFKSLGADYLYIHVPFMIVLYGTAAFAMVRFGLITLFSTFFILDVLLNLPMTSDFSSWFIGGVIFAYASVAALALWAFHTALAGQKLWKEELFD
ncbi:MAG: protein kinase [Acidobacteria bacterium]|nr:protein kinase [Acidobacteriota bacterium]